MTTALRVIFILRPLAMMLIPAAAAPFATIQHAINTASAGDTIFVDAGTYTENVTINKELTISGAGQGITTIYPAVSSPNPGGDGTSSLYPGSSNVMLVQASNVTISALTIDGDNPNLTSGVVRGGADIDARNGIITD